MERVIVYIDGDGWGSSARSGDPSTGLRTSLADQLEDLADQLGGIVLIIQVSCAGLRAESCQIFYPQAFASCASLRPGVKNQRIHLLQSLSGSIARSTVFIP